MPSSPICFWAESGARVESSERAGKRMSVTSIMPPGVRFLGVCVRGGEREEGWGWDVLETLLEEARPAGERTCHETAVDEIEFRGKGPGFF